MDNSLTSNELSNSVSDSEDNSTDTQFNGDLSQRYVVTRLFYIVFKKVAINLGFYICFYIYSLVPLFDCISTYIAAYATYISFKNESQGIVVPVKQLFCADGVVDEQLVTRLNNLIKYDRRLVTKCLDNAHISQYKNSKNTHEFTLYKHTFISQYLIDEVHKCELEMIAKNQQSLSSTTNTTTETIPGILSPIANSNEINNINMSSSTNPVADLFPADVLDPARYTHYSSGPRRGYVQVQTPKPRKKYKGLKKKQQKAILKQFTLHLESFGSGTYDQADLSQLILDTMIILFATVDYIHTNLYSLSNAPDQAAIRLRKKFPYLH